MNSIIEKLAARQREKIKEVEMLNQKMMMAAAGLDFKVTQVSVSSEVGLAIKTDGTLWSWGDNDRYITAQGTDVGETQIPTQVGTDTDWEQVNVAAVAGFAIKTDGTLWSWGDNLFYATGQGTGTGETQTPTQVGTDTDWAQVSAGSQFGLAIKTDGTLWSWGDNSHYKTAQGTDSDNTQTPTQVGSDTTWSQVSCGNTHGVAIKTDGTMWSWGWNIDFVTAQGTDVADTQTPTQIGSDTTWEQVSAGSFAGFAIKTNGTLWSWGVNSFYATGQGTSTGDTQTPAQIGSDTDWAQVSASLSSYGFAMKTDDTLYSWGSNANFRTAQSTDSGSTQTPTQVGSDTNWFQVSCGSTHCVAIKTDDTLLSWGSNATFRTGQGTDTGFTETPTQVDPF